MKCCQFSKKLINIEEKYNDGKFVNGIVKNLIIIWLGSKKDKNQDVSFTIKRINITI